MCFVFGRKEKAASMQNPQPQTTVVKIRRSKGEVVQGCDVYVGRRQHQGGWNLEDSIYHNPYAVKKYGLEESLRLYTLHLNTLIRKDPNVWIQNLLNLHGKVLGCWCKPSKCHGDILKQYADNLKTLYDQDLQEPVRPHTFPRVNAFVNSLVIK